jgi:HEAT repeat protein
VPIFGPPNIAKLKKKGKIKDLIKALNYNKDSKIQIEAVQALSELQCRESVEPICSLLNQFWGLNIELSLSCANALGKMPDPAAVKPLIEAVVRTKYESDLEKILQSKRELLLQGMGFDRKSAENLSHLWISALYDYMQIVRISAIKALGNIESDQAVAALIDALKDPNSVVSRYAADSLAKIGRDSVKAIILLLHGPDAHIRQLAVRALSQINGEEAKRQLHMISSDSDSVVRSYIELSSSPDQWKPPRQELVRELKELLDLYLAANMYFEMISLRPGTSIDKKSASESSAKDSVQVLAEKYRITDPVELEEIMMEATRDLPSRE